MSYHRTPVERPRHGKTFLTVRNVEDMAATGTREIVCIKDLVITDAAREVAHDLGIRILTEEQYAERTGVASGASLAPVRLPTPPITQAAQHAPASVPPARPVLRAEHKVRPGASGDVAMATYADPLVQEVVRAIRARWRPTTRHPRKLQI